VDTVPIVEGTVDSSLIEKILECLRSGMSIRATARHLGVCRKTVQQGMKK
jgi:transposase-like protein